jgi:hypothetical protein
MRDRPAFETNDEVLDEALAESFPASDPLSYWSGPDIAGVTRATAEPGPGDADIDDRP